MTEIHPGLVELAEAMEATPFTATDSLGRPWACEKCPDCGGAIIPPGTDGRIGHLTLEHGWRLDGRRFDNANRLQEAL